MSPFASPSAFRHDSWLRHTKLDRQLEDRGLARVGSRDDPGGRRGDWLSSPNPSASRMPSAEGVGILDRRIARAQANVSARKTTSPAIQGSPHGLTHPTYPSAPMVPVGPGSGAVLAALGKPATSRRRRTETSAIAMPARTIRTTRVFDIHRRRHPHVGWRNHGYRLVPPPRPARLRLRSCQHTGPWPRGSATASRRASAVHRTAHARRERRPTRPPSRVDARKPCTSARPRHARDPGAYVSTDVEPSVP
jgi:hypothetical protein